MIPNLVRHYKAAMQRYYNSTPTVPDTYNDKFFDLEVELMTHQISSKHYAEAQAVLWKPWVEKMHLQHLPLNIFLGIAAKSRYNKLLSMPSVEPVLDRETELAAFGMMFERAFAEWYMQQILYKVGIRDETQALDVYLDTYSNENLLYAWLDYCDNFGRIILIRRIIEQYSDAWSIRQVCSSYFDLSCRYVEKQVKRKKELSSIINNLDWRSLEYKRADQALEKTLDEIENLKYGSLL
jgi:hypothetical protein